MNPNIAERYAFAMELAREAGDLSLRYFRHADRTAAREKAPRDVVTEADLAIDRLIVARITERFPVDHILTEESGGETGANGTWVVDPIDGTANFARGIAHFAVSIAYNVAGQTEIGVIYDPPAGEIFSARKGHGAFCNGTPIHVSTIDQPNQAIIDAGYSRKHPLPQYVALLQRLLDGGYDFLHGGSAASGLAQVACGRVDGYCELLLNSWDVLAGLLLVEEAGGCANAFVTSETLKQRNAVLACGPGLADSLRRVTEIA
jgi:myo-inositol-1(or 4)-monophosphatase